MSKEKMKALRSIVVIAAAVAGIWSLALAGYEQSKSAKAKSAEDLYAQVELFANALSIIRSDYVEEIEPKRLIYGAIDGMLASLDEFSQFMDPEEFKEIKIEAKGRFGGIGVEISMKDRIITVIAPIAGTPADAAGIKPGDRIVKIDGRITKDMTLDEAVKLMRGSPGTTVALSVWRESEGKVLDVPIKRAMININSIKDAALLEDKIGYIQLVEFQENTPRDIENALKKLEAGGMESLILDLRNNPGGLLDIAVDVAEKFLPKDTVIVSIKARLPEQNAVFRSKGRFNHPARPLIVLVNYGSASGAEIVAGAIQDNKRGIILGTKTYGKASVQTVIPLKDSSAIRLTTASYLTPNGRIIRGLGIVPDVIEDAEPRREKPKPNSADLFESLGEKGSPALERTAVKEKIKDDDQLNHAVDLIKALKAIGAG